MNFTYKLFKFYNLKSECRGSQFVILLISSPLPSPPPLIKFLEHTLRLCSKIVSGEEGYGKGRKETSTTVYPLYIPIWSEQVRQKYTQDSPPLTSTPSRFPSKFLTLEQVTHVCQQRSQCCFSHLPFLLFNEAVLELSLSK